MTIIISDEDKKILERMHRRVDRILSLHKEYFDALAEFDKTGVLKIRGKVLYAREYNEDKHENLNASSSS